MRKIKAVKTPRPQPKFLTQSQFEQLRLACGNNLRDRAILEVYYSTGCRVSELQTVNVDDINWQDGSLRVVGKGQKERTVYINDTAALHLKRYLIKRAGMQTALFTVDRAPGNRMCVRSIQEVFTRLGVSAGLSQSIHPHLMRHTIATTLLRKGTDMAKIQQMLGHSSPSTTQRYAINDDASVHDAHRRCS